MQLSVRAKSSAGNCEQPLKNCGVALGFPKTVQEYYKKVEELGNLGAEVTTASVQNLGTDSVAFLWSRSCQKFIKESTGSKQERAKNYRFCDANFDFRGSVFFKTCLHSLRMYFV